MKKQRWIHLSLVSLIAFSPGALADNITIRDPAPDTVGGVSWGFSNNTFGPFSTNGNDGEDNETENAPLGSGNLGTIREQKWDTEGFSYDGNNLYLVGGYNFMTGQEHGGYNYKPGHLFIQVGGAAPDVDPLQYPNGPGTVSNSEYDYMYALDLSSQNGSAIVYTLNDQSILNTVVYDFLGSNPWKYSSGAVDTTTTPLTYYQGLTPNGPGDSVVSITGEQSFATLKGDSSDILNNHHNVVSIDLSFLEPLTGGQPIWVHYTMECGNDVVKGQYTPVPEGGATIVLLGFGVLSLVLFGRKRLA